MKVYLAGGTRYERERQLLKVYKRRLMTFFYIREGEVSSECWRAIKEHIGRLR